MSSLKATEDVPELEDDEPTPETALLGSARDERTTKEPPHPFFIRVIVIIVLAVFILEIADFMARAPLLRILEDIVCRKYYASSNHLSTPHLIPEDKCKLPAVQAEIAMLGGWNQAFACIPAVFLAVPYGYIGDRYGRKIVLILALFGLLLSIIWTCFVVYFNDIFNLRWIWAGNLFLLIGGGGAVANNAIFTFIADVTPESKRGPIFFQITAAALISTVVGIPLSWWIMKTDPFVALSIATGFVGVGIVLILFLPETLEVAKRNEAAFHHQNPGLDSADETTSSTPRRPSKIDLKVSILESFESSRFVWSNKTLCALTFTFLLSSLNSSAITTLFQLASHRFHWKLADASFLVPFSSITNFVVLVVVLPVLYTILGSRFHLRPPVKDHLVARGSLVILILGALFIAFSPTPAMFVLGTFIFACGNGYMASTRSLLTSFVHADQVSRLYAVLAIITTIGNIVTAPLLSTVFGVGMNLGGLWSGMAFLTVAALYAVLGAPLWIVKPPRREEDVHG